MHKFKNLVTYGCSLTKDNYFSTWADYLADYLDLPLTNYAERGAGYDYISDMVLKSMSDVENTLCVIMWPTADRWDLWVNDAVPHLQDDIKFASWLDGNDPTFCTLEGDYSTKRGYCFNGAVPRGLKHLYYKYFYTQEFHMNKAWKTIVLVQNYLEQKNVPYIMCNTYPLRSMIQYNYDEVSTVEESFLAQIDLEKFVDNALNEGFMGYCDRHKFDMFNAHYPKTDAHEDFTKNIILPKLTGYF